MSIFQIISRSLSGPTCHLKDGEKEWIEHRFLWLLEQFGPVPAQREPLHHNSALLPRKWNGTHEACDDLMIRLCRFMLVDPARVQLQFISQPGAAPISHNLLGSSEHSGAAGLYYHPKEGAKSIVIALEEAGLVRPTKVTATICHELGHVHLLGDGRISRDAKDSEPLTDLLTVFFGAGIFTANSAFEFIQWQDTSSQGWQASRMGYLPEQAFGYALACHAWLRGEAKPAWRIYLRENIRYYFDDSLHFLAKTKRTSLPYGVARPDGMAGQLTDQMK